MRIHFAAMPQIEVMGVRPMYPGVFHVLHSLMVFIYVSSLAHSSLQGIFTTGELYVDCFNQSFLNRNLFYESPVRELTALSTCSKYCFKKWFDAQCLQYGDNKESSSTYCMDGVLYKDNPSKFLTSILEKDVVVNASSLKKPFVSILTNGTVYSTDMDVTFFVVTDEIGPLNFSWDFGDQTVARTTSRSITKRYSVPHRFLIKVNASNQMCSFSSNVHSVFIQQRIIPNRLAANSSVVVNSKAAFNCRINAGTDIIYLWNFGDGTVRYGESSETYTYMREGEFMVNVTLLNNISSAFLTKQIFVVKEPCQPPPVKYMGPQKIKIRRYEELHLGVTFEGPIQCNISQGITYYWSLAKFDGYLINLPDCGRPRIAIPRFFLDYGKYTAIARVQIVGNVVYSNYTVPLEILHSDPVSIISGGTHQFLDRNTMFYKLNGTSSYDPDYPGAQLRFIWKCAPAGLQTLSCFNSAVQNPLQSNSSIITFPIILLDSKFDQYQFTLIIKNGNRTSSSAHSFLSIKMHSKLRQIELICSECKDYSVNWNQRFSMQVSCTYCNKSDQISYFWNLYWINATESKTIEVPFCKVLDRKAPSSMIEFATHTADNTAALTHGENVFSGETQFESPYSLQRYDKNDYRSTIKSENQPDAAISTVKPDVDYINIGKAQSSSSLNMLDVPFLLSSILEDGSSDAKPNGISKDNFPFTSEFEPHSSSIHEGEVGSRRRIAETLETQETPIHFAREDNLVDLSNAVVPSSATIMLDWPRLQISDPTFQNYTLGISSQTVTFNPFVLKPNNMYMLDVSLASHGNTIGKSQIYFKVIDIPKSVTCQVQPREGYEMYTVFSVFCSSGKEDLQYEFSYQTSASDRKTLYKGWDIQYYFNLPAGDQSNAYRVTIFSQVSNSFGSKTQLCPVNITVLPSFIRNLSTSHLPELELFNDGRRNLSTLLLMRNYVAIRNYVILITKVLNRLYTEENKAAFELQSKMRNLLISIVCSLEVQDQEDITDVVSLLLELMNNSKQVTADSAILIVTTAKTLLKEHIMQNHTLMQRDFTKNMISLITHTLDVSLKHSETHNVALDGLESVRDLILRYIHMSEELEINISTNLMELHTKVYKDFGNKTLEIASIRLNLPLLLDLHGRKNSIPNMTCFVTQLLYFKKQPFVWTTSSSQFNDEFGKHNSFDCFRRTSSRDFAPPVSMKLEFETSHNSYFNRSLISLSWNKVNYHHFNITPKNNEGVFHITIRFSRPNVRAFPVLILMRHLKKPSTTHFHKKQIFYWEGNFTQISISTDSIKDKGSIFLALMDADFKRQPKNKYLSTVINYSIDVHWSTCLYWLSKKWISEDCAPQVQFNCSCLKFGVYTSMRQQVINNTCTENVSQFVSAAKNLVPCTIVFLSVCIYIFLGAICKLKDAHEEKKNGFVLLQDNSSNDQQLYAIIVEIGFRSRPKATAKVHIILHGEDGVSETRQLYCKDKPLFERNSRYTFIMSIPDTIGTIWKIHIWHDNSGDAPSLYISHIVIKDLKNGNNAFFLAECWLAIDEADGKVERELTAMVNGLSFRKLFYCKFTEYLEDFHLWASVISRPSYSGFTYTQRITVCFVLLFGYMCLNSILLHHLEEQYTAELGFLDISVISLKSGILVTLAIYPLAVLLSLLFRFSEKHLCKDTGKALIKAARESQTTTEGYQNYIPDGTNESSLNWQYLQYWASDTWKKKYERNVIPDIQSRNCSKVKNGSPTPSNQCLRGFEDCSSKGFRPTLKEICSDYISGHNSMFKYSIFNVCNILPPWCAYLGWLFCTVINIISAMVTVFLGFRFGHTKCVLWLHTLFCSLIYCSFVVQPVAIFLLALIVAWKNQQKTDFFAQTVCQAMETFLCQPSLFTDLYATDFMQKTKEKANFDEIIAARRRARYLRLARPPTPAELRVTKRKIRRKTLIQNTYRDCILYMIMMSMLMITALEVFSDNKYSLNQAVTNQLIRNGKQPFDKIRTIEHWWNWNFNVLLDGLYKDTWYSNLPEKSEAGPTGKFFLIGKPNIMQFRCNADFVIPSLLRWSSPGCILSYLKQHVVNSTSAQCDKIRVVLGRSRDEAYSTLSNLRNEQSVDWKTRTLLVRFSLYNPSTNLFTVALLSLEFPTPRDVITSSVIESVRIYHIVTFQDYLIMTFKLLYLAVIIFHLYLQMSSMIHKGILKYWQEPWNWAEMCMIMLSFGYYASRTFYLMFAMDIIDRLQKDFFKEFVNFDAIIALEQWSRCLFGFMLFFMIIKLIKLLSVFKMMVSWMNMLHRFCVSTHFLMIAGAVFSLAYASLGHLKFHSNIITFSSLLKSLRTVLLHLLKAGYSKNTFTENTTKSYNLSEVCFYWSFFVALALLWTGMAKGVLVTFAESSKKANHAKHLISFKEIIIYAWENILLLTGIQRSKSTEKPLANGNNFCFDEFEDLIDELLFKLNAISNSLHSSLPAKPLCYTEEEDEVNCISNCSSVYIKQSLENSLCSEEDIQEENRLVMKTDLESATLNIKLHGFLCSNENFKSYDISPGNSESVTDDVPCRSASSINCEGHTKFPTNGGSGNEFTASSESFESNSSEKLYFNKGYKMLYHHSKPLFCSDKHTDYINQHPEAEGGINRQICHTVHGLCKNSKPLKRSHTTVIEPIDNGIPILFDKMFQDNRSIAFNNLQHDVPTEIPLLLDGQTDFTKCINQEYEHSFDIKKENTQICTQHNKEKPFEEVETIFKETIKVPAESAVNLGNPVHITSSVRQCW